MTNPPEHTPEDMEAWLEANPFDRGYEHQVIGTVGFQSFLFTRRVRELERELHANLDSVTRDLLVKATQAKSWISKRWSHRRLIRHLKRMARR